MLFVLPLKCKEGQKAEIHAIWHAHLSSQYSSQLCGREGSLLHNYSLSWSAASIQLTAEPQLRTGDAWGLIFGLCWWNFISISLYIVEMNSEWLNHAFMYVHCSQKWFGLFPWHTQVCPIVLFALAVSLMSKKCINKCSYLFLKHYTLNV